MARVHTVNIYLLKPDVTQARHALRDDIEELNEHAFVTGDTRGVVFVAPAHENEPDWVKLLRTSTQPPVDQRSQSTSAVLVLQVAGRWFALAFGHGRTLLEPAHYVRRFGLRVALNAINPEQLRGAQARTFNDHALQTQRQISRLARIEALELDFERDLVTALGGTLADQALGRRIDGHDRVRLTAELDAGALADKCAQLLTESQQTRYKETFPWIDTIEEITDPVDIIAFESRAAEMLGQRNFAPFDLFPPELLSDEIVDYRVSPSRGGLVIIEPDSSHLGLAIHAPMSGNQARAALDKHRLLALNERGEIIARWPFWDCLHLELTLDGARLVLDDGHWYRIEKRFADDVDAFTAALKPSGLPLPLAIRDQNESSYNIRAAQDPRFALLDRTTIKLLGRTAIEPCDLFGDAGHLVHVKRRKGGSAPLSHLIGQASVSASLMLDEPEFRAQLRSRLKSARPGFERFVAEPANPAAHSIVLALITTTAATGKVGSALPFFTKVFLRQNVRRLQHMGFSVFLDEIPVALPQVSSRLPGPARRRRARVAAPSSPRRP
jgi:uncharacterized protein (TIGR04141 family)